MNTLQSIQNETEAEDEMLLYRRSNKNSEKCNAILKYTITGSATMTLS